MDAELCVAELPSLTLAAAGGDWSTTEETTHVDPDDLFRRLAGRDDLETVTFLEFTVDTAEHSIGDLGVRVPALEQLKLSGSNVATVRDLGLLRNVQVLWLARSGVHDLEGISALPVLRELYAAFNNVSDLSPLMAPSTSRCSTSRATRSTTRRCSTSRSARSSSRSRCSTTPSPTPPTSARRSPRAAAPRAPRRRAAPAPERRRRRARRRGGSGGGGGGGASAAAAALSAPPPPAAGAAALPQCAPTGRPSTAPAKGDAAGASGGGRGRRRRARGGALALIRDGIKYADALRAFDVQSFEALSVASVASGARTPRHRQHLLALGSRPPSSWPPSSLASARGPRRRERRRLAAATPPPRRRRLVGARRRLRRSTPDDGASRPHIRPRGDDGGQRGARCAGGRARRPRRARRRPPRRRRR